MNPEFFTSAKGVALVHRGAIWGTVHLDLLRRASDLVNFNAFDYDRIEIPDALDSAWLKSFVSGIVYRRWDDDEGPGHTLGCLAAMAFFESPPDAYRFLDARLCGLLRRKDVREQFEFVVEHVYDLFEKCPETWSAIRRIRRAGTPVLKNETAIALLKSPGYDVDTEGYYATVPRLREVVRARRAMGRTLPRGLKSKESFRAALRNDTDAVLDLATRGCLDELRAVYRDASSSAIGGYKIYPDGSVFRCETMWTHAQIAPALVDITPAAMCDGYVLRRYNGFQCEYETAFDLRDRIAACFYDMPRNVQSYCVKK